MATHVEHGTRCAVCRRSLLVGESARTYQDPRTRGIQTVCLLCTGRADKSGWQLVGEREARRPLPVGPGNAVDHERLVGRLQTDLERLERDVGGKADELAGERASRAQLEARLAALEEELAGARAENIGLLEQLGGSDGAIADAERRAKESLEAQEMLLRARRREADPVYVCGIACEVFNRSDHLAVVLAACAEHGDVRIRIGVDGIMLPRTVKVIFAWSTLSRSYRVTCDLVARIFDVEDIGHGPGPVAPPFSSNGRIEAGRLVTGAAS